MKHLYSTRALASGGRHGQTRSEDGKLVLDLSMPGSGGTGTNPEQLFALGYAACFDNAVKVVAQRQRIALKGSTTTATVAMGQVEGGAYALDVALDIEIEGLDQAQAEALVHAAHQVCPYSNALRGNVAVALTVNARA